MAAIAPTIWIAGAVVFLVVMEVGLRKVAPDLDNTNRAFYVVLGAVLWPVTLIVGPVLLLMRRSD